MNQDQPAPALPPNFYQTLFNNLPLGVVYHAQDGAVAAANPAAEAILGLSLEQLRGRTSFDPRWRAIHPDGSDFPGQDHPAMQALRSGQPVKDVVMGVFNPRTTAYTWVNINAQPLSRAPGEPPCAVYATFEDITLRKQNEEALAASRRTLQLFVQHAPAAIAMFDRHMVYLAASQRYRENYHLGEQELIGRSFNEVFPEVSIRWGEIFARCLTGAVESAAQDPFPRQDGRLDWVRWEVHPWRDDAGEVGGILLFSEVITERVQAEHSLRESEERLRLASEVADLGAWRADLRAGVLDMDERARRHHGLPQGNLHLTDMLARVHPDDLARVRADFAAAIAPDSGGQVSGEYRVIHPDGSLRWLLAGFRVTFAAQGAARQPLELFGASLDITARVQAERELAAAHRQTQDILDSIGDPVYSLDEANRFLFVNRAATRAWGKTPAELVGKSLWEVFPPQLLAETSDRIRQVQADRQPARYEILSKVVKHWIEVHIYPTERGVAVYFQDIQARKQAEQQVRQLNRLYVTLSQVNQTIVYAGSPQELFTDICQVAVEHSQFPLAWIGVYDPRSGRLAPVASSAPLPFDDFNILQAPYQGGLADIAISTGRLAFCADLLNDPGLQHWHAVARAEGFNSAAAVPLRRGGAIVGLLTLFARELNFFSSPAEQNLVEKIGVDISFALDALEAQRIRRQWADAFENCAHGIGIGLPESETMLTCNNAFARLQGYTPEEISAKPILEMYTPEERARVRKLLTEADRTGSSRFETRMLRKDGSAIPVQMDIVSVRDDNGRLLYRVATQQDISERLRAAQALQAERDSLAQRVEERTAELTLANAELVRAGQAKDEFLSTMSHELRTPLNGILNLSESLQEGVYGPLERRQVETLGSIRESGKHLLSLINDILDISKAETGQLELQLEPVDVGELVETAVRLVRPQASRKKLRLATALDAIPGTVAADPRRLKQMLVNLLSNAIKFTPQGGEIGLEVTRLQEGDALRFTVWDTGIGITADKLPLLFQPFTQVDSALSREFGGSGLGLSLVRRMAELHGGSVGVETEPGRGSRFWFTIPVVQVTESPSGSALPTGGTLLAPRRALIIEDSPTAAEHLTRYLRELSTEVTVCVSGEDAVQRAIEEQPDVILLDLLLPDTSGWVVLTALKTNPRTAEIPVVIISVVDERGRGLAGGAVEYLVKPVTRDQVYGAIQRAVAPSGHAHRVLLIRSPQPAPPVRAERARGALILFAEDNLINLETYTDFLKSRGYRVIPATNGYDAIERAREFTPDLILMDIQMPGLDGLEAIRRLRAMPEFGATPIAALTALAMPGDRERCLAAGANEYLAKPVGLLKLQETINNLLAGTS